MALYQAIIICIQFQIRGSITKWDTCVMQLTLKLTLFKFHNNKIEQVQ